MMPVAALEAEYADLQFPRFAEAEAWALGQKLVQLAGTAPVVINIRSAERVFFHASLPGSAPLNDLWARRKSNTALLFQLPSFLVGQRHRANGGSLSGNGLAEADYAGVTPHHHVIRHQRQRCHLPLRGTPSRSASSIEQWWGGAPP